MEETNQATDDGPMQADGDIIKVADESFSSDAELEEAVNGGELESCKLVVHGKIAGENDGKGKIARENDGKGKIAGENDGKGKIAGENDWKGKFAGENDGKGKIEGENDWKGKIEGKLESGVLPNEDANCKPSERLATQKELDEVTVDELKEKPRRNNIPKENVANKLTDNPEDVIEEGTIGTNECSETKSLASKITKVPETSPSFQKEKSLPQKNDKVTCLSNENMVITNGQVENNESAFLQDENSLHELGVKDKDIPDENKESTSERLKSSVTVVEENVVEMFEPLNKLESATNSDNQMATHDTEHDVKTELDNETLCGNHNKETADDSSEDAGDRSVKKALMLTLDNKSDASLEDNVEKMPDPSENSKLKGIVSTPVRKTGINLTQQLRNYSYDNRGNISSPMLTPMNKAPSSGSQIQENYSLGSSSQVQGPILTPATPTDIMKSRTDRKMASLMMYSSPSVLSPLNTPVSRRANKGFKPPAFKKNDT